MRYASLLSWRQALLTGLGIATACGGEVAGGEPPPEAEEPAGGAAGGLPMAGAPGGLHRGGAGGSQGGNVPPGTAGTAGASAGGASTGDASTGGASTGGASTGGASTGGSSGTGGLGGVQHRPAAIDCEPMEPRSESQVPAGWDAGVGTLDCTFDSDCVEQPQGYCVSRDQWGWGGLRETRCRYGCVADSDCSEGTVCDCDGFANRCVPAGCAADSECDSGLLCLRTEHDDGCDQRVQYRCQTPQDECAVDADCPPEQQCTYRVHEARHACAGVECAIGRPFLVGGIERLAPARRTDAWCGDAGRRPAIPAPRAAVLAERWARIGLMEHASVAAFARFALELLAFGAPPELVEAASAAMSDETRHARIAFGFASRYAGAPVGPGTLSLEGAMGEMDLARVVANVVLEGCCGETVAAHEARVAADGAADAEISAALRGIAGDEQRHAELAWRFVHWALGRNPALRDMALETVERELERARAASTPASGEEGWLSKHGIVPEAERRLVRIEALEHVALPCMQAICAAPLAA